MRDCQARIRPFPPSAHAHALLSQRHPYYRYPYRPAPRPGLGTPCLLIHSGPHAVTLPRDISGSRTRPHPQARTPHPKPLASPLVAAVVVPVLSCQSPAASKQVPGCVIVCARLPRGAQAAVSLEAGRKPPPAQFVGEPKASTVDPGRCFSPLRHRTPLSLASLGARCSSSTTALPDGRQPTARAWPCQQQGSPHCTSSSAAALAHTPS